jgi:hypothetical protein
MMRAVRNLTTTLACLPALWLALCWPGSQAWADPAPFDLAGPNMTVSVTHQGATLPIASVPQLSAGDTVKVQVALPATETAHYLLVAGFLRDPTNPPPDGWFFRSETWKAARRGGGALDLTVPAGANHLVLFLAPATGGDFATLRKAVQARPGAFVRAAQDLEQASLDRSRFETYLATIRSVAAKTPEALAHDAPIIAGSLRIKINEECLQRQAEFQAACLLDSKQSVVLGGDGAASTSAVTGAAADLLLSLSATPAGGAAQRPVSVHSGAGAGPWRHVGAGSEYPALVCRSEIRVDGGLARGQAGDRPGAASACRCYPTVPGGKGAACPGGHQSALLRHHVCP